MVQIAESKFNDAEENFLKAKVIADKADCDNYYRVAPLIGLGLLRFDTHKLTEAATLWEETLELVEQNNFDFSLRASVVKCLANVYETQGKTERLEELYKDVISIYDYNNKFDSEGIAATFSDYGTLLTKTNQLASAEPMFKQAFAIFKRFGDQSREAKVCRENYAALLRKLNREDAAKKIEATP